MESEEAQFHKHLRDSVHKWHHIEPLKLGIPTRLAKKDLIPGGLADHKPDSSFNPKSIRKGIKVEKEHTSNPQVAKEIAKDHLSESSTYYDDLAQMEQPEKFSESAQDHEAFHRAMEEDPENAPKVYADYLEENGKPGIASVVRSFVTRPLRVLSNPDDFYQKWKQGEFSFTSRPNHLAYLRLRSMSKPERYFYWSFDPDANPHIDTDQIRNEVDYDHDRGERKEQMSRSQPSRFAQQTNYAITRRELGSKNAQTALALTEQVLKKAKLTPYQIEKVIHQLGNTAFPSIGFQIHHDHPAENVVYGASWNGLISQQPGFLVFGADEDGSDSLYHFTVSSNIQNLPQLLTQAGFQSFWIKPSQEGSRVTVWDKGRRLRQLIERLATELAIEVTEHLGNSVVVGHQDQSRARQIYRQIIREFESSGGAV